MTIAKKSKYRDTLAAEIAAGATMVKAAEKAGCSVQHGYNISRDPSFQQQVASIRSEAVARAVGRLSRASTLAVDTLVHLLSVENEPKDRLNAAKAILATLGPLSELGELRERIDRLEQTKLRIAK